MSRRVAMLMAATLILGACARDEGAVAPRNRTPASPQAKTPASSPTPTPAAVVFKTKEYSYEAPSSFPGGLVAIELDNSEGKEAHEAELTRLDPGRTLADVKNLDPDEPPPSFMHAAGGPGPVLPGKKATYRGNLEPGTYILRCFVPTPGDGNPHLEKGMVAQVQVTEGQARALPQADITVGATEFKFSGTEGLRAGVQTVRVENQGQQAHNWALFALASGKSSRDVTAFFEADEPPPGPPPFTGIAGLVGTLPPGRQATRTVELDKGATYAFICFIPDKDGKPHFAKGMVTEVAIP